MRSETKGRAALQAGGSLYQTIPELAEREGLLILGYDVMPITLN